MQIKNYFSVQFVGYLLVLVIPNMSVKVTKKNRKIKVFHNQLNTIGVQFRNIY